MLTVFCDGGARGNPGPAAFGFVVKDKQKILKKGKGYIGEATNNFAEYTAILEAFKYLDAFYKGKNLDFYLDSLLAVSQLNGIYKVKNANIREFLVKIRELETEFGQIRYNHVPREQNKEADALVNEVLDSHGY